MRKVDLTEFAPESQESGKTSSTLKWIPLHSRCLKIPENVSYNIASEASYIYILSEQKFIKKAKNGPFWRVFENLKLTVKQCYQTGHFK